MDTDALIAFLCARLDDEAAAARAVEPLGHIFDMGGNQLDERFTHRRVRHRGEDGTLYVERDAAAQAHFARHDPARVLAEVDAKRRILDEVMPALDDLNPEWPDDRPHHTDLLAVLKLLAAPYVGHPDFREEWKP